MATWSYKRDVASLLAKGYKYVCVLDNDRDMILSRHKSRVAALRAKGQYRSIRELVA